MAKSIILEGWISILAALIANNRQIKALYLQHDKHNTTTILLEQQARVRGVPLLRVDKTIIADRAVGHSHGGIIALVGPRQYQSLEALGQGVSSPFIAILDGVEDSFNMSVALNNH